MLKLHPNGMSPLTVHVRRVATEAEGILSFEFVPAAGETLPKFTAGAHIDVHLPNGMVRQYSLCNDPHEPNRYVIAVQKEPQGRGGSSFLCDKVRPGDSLRISQPRNNFPLCQRAERTVLIAGGIGITPILSMVRVLATAGADWRLYYCARTPSRTAFTDLLAEPAFVGRTSLHHDWGDPQRGLDLISLFRDHDPGTHVYCCGPTSLMAAVGAATAHWPPQSMHYEHFKAAEAVGGRAAFTVRLARTESQFEVPPDQSILDVLLAGGVDVASSCEEGICGTCKMKVLAGEVDHRDQVLSAEEIARGDVMMVCVSRAKGPFLVLDC